MAQDFAEVDLGVAGVDDQVVPPAEPVPAWQRHAVLAGLFVFGLLVGALGWQARVDNAVHIELSASETLVRAEIDPDNPTLRQFGLSVYNAGSYDLTLVGLALPGWEPRVPDERDQTLRSGTWTPLSVPAVPTCDVPAPEQVLATVRHERTDVAVSLELPPGPEGLGLGAISDACAGVEAPLTVTTLQDRQWLNARADDGRLVAEMSVHGSAADHAVLAVSAAAEGLSGNADSVPASMLGGGRVDVLWEVADCAAAEDVSEVVLDITVDSVAGERTESVPFSDPYLTYLLANYVAREC